MNEKKQQQLGRPRASDKTQPTDELIIQAATFLFLENGYPNVSVEDVAKKCHMTKATVYYYYASKAELFTETMVQMMVRIRGKIEAFLQENLPLKERLKKITKTHLQSTVDFDMDGFMKGVKNALSNEQQEKIHQAENQMYQAIEDAFCEAMERNEIRALHPRFAAHAYLSLLKVGHYNNEKEPLYPSIDEVTEQIIELFWQGIQRKEGGSM